MAKNLQCLLLYLQNERIGYALLICTGFKDKQRKVLHYKNKHKEMLILFVFPNFILYGFNYYYSAALDFLFDVRFLSINYVFIYLLFCVGVCA